MLFHQFTTNTPSESRITIWLFFLADLSSFIASVCGSSSSDQSALPSDSTSQLTPLLSLIHPVIKTCSEFLPYRFCSMSGAPKKIEQYHKLLNDWFYWEYFTSYHILGGLWSTLDFFDILIFKVSFFQIVSFLVNYSCFDATKRPIYGRLAAPRHTPPISWPLPGLISAAFSTM